MFDNSGQYWEICTVSYLVERTAQCFSETGIKTTSISVTNFLVLGLCCGHREYFNIHYRQHQKKAHLRALAITKDCVVHSCSIEVATHCDLSLTNPGFLPSMSFFCDVEVCQPSLHRWSQHPHCGVLRLIFCVFTQIQIRWFLVYNNPT